jgi:benzylsuccinate CoA-transferase BbsF subunit
VLGALEWRRRSGRGQLVDLSQAESSIHFLAPALVEAEAAGFRWTRMGNADRFAAPHAVYPAEGSDAWVAVVCETDAQWRALAGVLGRDDLAGLGPAERLGREAELDRLVAGFTASRPIAEIEARLQAAGVPVHGVQNSAGCAADPQLIERAHFRTVAHPVHRTCVVEGPRLRLSRTPGDVRRAGPSLGEDNDVVLRELLGYDDDRVTELVISGALE